MKSLPEAAVDDRLFDPVIHSQSGHPPRRPPVIAIAVLSFAMILVAFAAANPIQTLNVPFGLVVSSLLIFGAAAVLLPHLCNLDARAFAGLGEIPLKTTGLAFLVGATNMLVEGFLMGAAREVLPEEWSFLADSTTRLLARADAPARVAFFVAAVIAAPIGEELFFRGWLQGLVSHRLRPFLSAFVIAVPFSFLHLDPVGFVARIELGLLFGLARAWTNSLWPAISMHAAHNGLQLVIFFAVPEELRDLEEPFSWGPSALLALAGLVGTIALLRLLRTSVPVPAPLRPLDPTNPPFTPNPAAAGRTAAITVAALVVSVGILGAWGRDLPGGDLLDGRNGVTDEALEVPLPDPEFEMDPADE